MDSASFLRHRVLAVAATSNRELTLPAAKETLPPARPAFGDEAPILVAGDCGDQSDFPKDIEALLVGADASELSSLAARLIGQGALPSRRLLAEADDLTLDLDRFGKQWDTVRPASLSDARRFLASAARESAEYPAIPDASFAAVYCGAINRLPDDTRRRGAIHEAFRVLRRGGVVRFFVDLADESGPGFVLRTEGAFTEALSNAGFYGIRIVRRSTWPVLARDGFEIRSYVVDAFRGKEGPCLDCHQAVIYRGPWKKVYDDDGHVFERDVRTAVCEKTFTIMNAEPYAGHLLPVEPHVAVPREAAAPFHCRSTVRRPAVTKGLLAEEDTTERCC